jgi:hypothetical protein
VAFIHRYKEESRTLIEYSLSFYMLFLLDTVFTGSHRFTPIEAFKNAKGKRVQKIK